MSLHDQFKDEAQFRDQFVKPLLNRMGFHGVEEQHGSEEFGKDFVFSELHRLAGMRHYAAQVKHEKKIHQGRAVDDLLSQIKQAFSKPFTRANSPRKCHVCAVYVLNDGEITQNAKDQLLSDLELERYGDNVHFLDGEHLRALNEWVIYQGDQDARLRLSALKEQLDLNIWLWSQWGIKITNTHPPTHEYILDGRASLLDGIEQYLSRPIPGEPIPWDAVKNLWLSIRLLDATRMRAYLNYAGPREIASDLASMRPIAESVISDAKALISLIDQALQTKFQPIR